MKHNKNSVNRANSKKKNNTTIDYDIEVPLTLAGESESLDADGNVLRRSRRYSMQAGKVGRQNAAVIQALLGILKNHKIKALPRIKAPKKSLRDLAVVYVLGDPHVGMYAWGQESGADFDLKIAERDLCVAIMDLIERSPAGEEALLVNLGDFFHMDNTRNMTERSGNILDADTRWPHVLQVGLRIEEFMVNELLKKHKHVTVINEIGNHDTHSTFMLMNYMNAVFRNNPRVTIDMSPMHHHYWHFGQTLIGVTHGDMTRMEKCPEVMSTQQRELWGNTRYHYWYTGHVHHHSAIEAGGATVESFRTLAPKDAWHAASGYQAGRDAQAIVLHREYGEIERRGADIALVHALAAKRGLKFE